MRRLFILLILAWLSQRRGGVRRRTVTRPSRSAWWCRFRPGAASDFLRAQPLGQKLSEAAIASRSLSTTGPVPAASSAARWSRKPRADGYTLGMVGQPHLMQPLLQREPPYRPLDDIVCVTQVASLPNVLVVSPQLPVKSVSDVIASQRLNRASLISARRASASLARNIAGEAHPKRPRASTWCTCPFKLIPDIFAEMLAGRVQLYMFPLPAVMPMLKDSKLHVVAVGTPQPSPALPGVPTMSESGMPGFRSESWFGIVAPAGTAARDRACSSTAISRPCSTMRRDQGTLPAPGRYSRVRHAGGFPEADAGRLFQIPEAGQRRRHLESINQYPRGEHDA